MLDVDENGKLIEAHPGGWPLKHILVSKLAELLNTLQPSDVLYPNEVGDLSIYRTNDNGEEDLDLIGVINISFDRVNLFDSQSDEE